VILGVALLMCLAIGASLLALRTVGAAAEQSSLAATALTVHVTHPRTPQALEAASAVTRRTPGVRSATPMDGARAAKLLETWSGAPVDPDSLPAAYLIEVRLAPDALRDTTKLDIAEQLSAVNVEADIFDSGPALDEADRAVTVAAWGSSGAVALLAAAVMLVARAGALARPEMALLVADLGGDKGQVIGKYGRNGAEWGFLGGALSVCGAILLGAAVYFATERAPSLNALLASVKQSEIALVVSAPLLSAALATLGARLGANRIFGAAERMA
jgi:cell division protein FtsX